MNQIESNYYQRVSHNSNNFSKTLSNEHSTIVSQIVKDPYNFDFINLHDEALERGIILTGPPYSGKGTQAEIIELKYGYIYNRISKEFDK